jgi:hypothetical protein
MIEGLRRVYPDDQALLSQGVVTFEALYQSHPRPRQSETAAGAGRAAAGRRR